MNTGKQNCLHDVNKDVILSRLELKM